MMPLDTIPDSWNHTILTGHHSIALNDEFSFSSTQLNFVLSGSMHCCYHVGQYISHMRLEWEGDKVVFRFPFGGYEPLYRFVPDGFTGEVIPIYNLTIRCRALVLKVVEGLFL